MRNGRVWKHGRAYITGSETLFWVLGTGQFSEHSSRVVSSGSRKNSAHILSLLFTLPSSENVGFLRKPSKTAETFVHVLQVVLFDPRKLANAFSDDRLNKFAGLSTFLYRMRSVHNSSDVFNKLKVTSNISWNIKICIFWNRADCISFASKYIAGQI